MSRQPIPAAFTSLDLPPLAPPRSLRTVLAGVGETLSRPLRLALLHRAQDRIARDVGVLTVRRDWEWGTGRLAAADVTTMLLRQKMRRWWRLNRERDEIAGGIPGKGDL